MWNKGFELLLFLCLFGLVINIRTRHHASDRKALKFLSYGIGTQNSQSPSSSNVGLWPSVFNLATKALINTNATCGERGREEFCKLSDGSKGRCGVCDNFNSEPGKRHAIHYAIDGSNRWWQSPTLENGPEYEFITITIDLKQIYQVAYVILKAANSPRPGAWILERSLDGENFEPWQYFARNDKECLERYGILATKGKPRYTTDTDVICTSHFSKLAPFENGEVHTSLIHGRPGANDTSPELLEFTKARFVRIRLQGFKATIDPVPRWIQQDPQLPKRLFYSIRDISIGGQCVCNGHASSCRHNVASGHPECECSHHTCGPNCNKCCPLYNQRPWGPGTSRDARQCFPCNCNGHAISCHYDETVERNGLSIDPDGNYRGGGVCDNCTDYTTGINCEQCIKGYFRPPDVIVNSDRPCIKCDCDPNGSTGNCNQEGPDAGTCECKPGYTGFKCDKCAFGYKGYPFCDMCLCDIRGVVPFSDCEGDCICKENVEGKFCENCKPGFFALRNDNSEGCLSCFCSGVTTLCESATLVARTFENREAWLITDLTISELVKPMYDPETNSVTIENYEGVGTEAYYWLAPKEYLGNKLESYGSHLSFSVSWTVIRGDTSGKPTIGPSIILVGQNGLKIGFGEDQFSGSSMVLKIILNENNWYHIPNNVKDIVTRSNQAEYKGDSVSRAQFMSVLTNIKHILLRASFHTDQIDGTLEYAVLKSGELGEDESYSSVEKCSCPSGYTGLSCESCEYGYVRIFANSSVPQIQGFCVKCDCNGHSKTCDPDTGQCTCEYNTIGEKCERCKPGFYGNPLMGTPLDCRRCACPLIEDENNFSPSCQLDFYSEEDQVEVGYVCTQCPKGYTGDHCEICDDGYFGNPKQLGSKCEPCSCGGGPCDSLTGQCLACPGNTEGWKCERCKSGHFGDPLNANCQACLCDSQGSFSQNCDNITGQCQCKEHFTGRTCDRCEEGYGNMTAKCVPCVCDDIGAVSKICHPQTGICECKIGVEGFHCDACQHLHFGFSAEGCQGCNCDPKGSEIPTCDITSGQCRCKPHYIGRTCNRCQEGYWDSRLGCEPCQCNPEGSESSVCHAKTGQCNCKHGVGGLRCDACLPNYYGFSEAGCKECDVCHKKGHICDPDTGKCVCPPYSYGVHCHLCVVNAWGYEPERGCRPCKCSPTGSTKQQCNPQTGECTCRLGYAGMNCDRCDHGYFGYPRCRPCQCDRSGTSKNVGNCTSNGTCTCDSSGQCPCKTNVEGKKCNKCKEGTFGLDLENPNGCTQCFCFGRSSKCNEAGLTWGQIRLNSSRILTVRPSDKLVRKDPPVTSNEIIESEELLVIPGIYGNLTIDSNHFTAPLYWQLHPLFTGDRILSYGGYLRFKIATFEPKYQLPHEILQRYPLVQLHSHGHIILEYYPLLPVTKDHYEIRLHESLWRKKQPEGFDVDQRKLFMIALQHVENIFIRATEYSLFDKLLLQDLTLDTAIEVPGNPPPIAKGVELCECPRQYNSTSCQNPSIGFYRYYTPTSVNGTIVISTLVGEAKPCVCNGRSEICDIETGYCLHCRHNTQGNFCERCADGYYGDPLHPDGKCEPCPCPSIVQNFAQECKPLVGRKTQFQCICKAGYTSAKCNKCTVGYYGNPQEPGGSCKPCNCNLEGVSPTECLHGLCQCDPHSGQCKCKPGITGKQCSQCEKPRHTLQRHGCYPCDNCTQWLLNDIEWMDENLNANTHLLSSGTLQPPWKQLREVEESYERFENRFSKHQIQLAKAEEMISTKKIDSLENDLKTLNKTSRSYKTKLNEISKTNNGLRNNVQDILDNISKTKTSIVNTINTLENFGNSHVNTREAVKQANQLLTEIRNIKSGLKDNKQVLIMCHKIEKKIKQMIGNTGLDPQRAKDDLKNLTNRLDELRDILREIDLNNRITMETNEKNNRTFNRLQSTVEKLNNLRLQVEDDLKQMKETMNKASEVLEKSKEFQNILSNEYDLEELTEKIEDLDLDEIESELTNYKTRVNKHVDELKDKVQFIINSFNFSKDADAIKAGTAYRTITKGVEEARNTTGDVHIILQTIHDQIYPDYGDPLTDNVSIAVADADRLDKRITIQKQKIQDLKEKVHYIKVKLGDVNSNNWQNGLDNKNQDKLIREIKEKLRGTSTNGIESVIRKANDDIHNMRNVHQLLSDLELRKQQDLLKPLEKMRNLTSPSGSIKGQVLNALKNLEEASEHKFDKYTLDKRKEENLSQLRHLNDAIAKRLQELRTSIQKARNIANVISVPLTGPTCSRSYVLRNLEPSLLTKLTVKFSYDISDETSSSSLFYLPAGEQYMHLKIVNNILVYELKLDNSSLVAVKQELTESGTYAVDIERTVNYVEMKINDSKIIKSKNNEKDQSEFGIFNATQSDLVHIGKGEDLYGIPSCITDVTFGDVKLGLWDFQNFTGECMGCFREVESIETGYDFFGGEGYALSPKENQIRKLKLDFYVQFYLRTFDENALLFLAPDFETGSYLAVTLQEGHVVYQIVYQNHRPIILRSSNRYNTGEKVKISAEKLWSISHKTEMALLSVGEESLEDVRDNIDKTSIVRLRKVDYYFGGVPPEYNKTGLTRKLHTHDSLLGGMEDVSEYQQFNFHEKGGNLRTYGIEEKNDELSFIKSWFFGEGYIKMKTTAFKTKILFLMYTDQKDAFIMKVDDFLEISLINGSVNAVYTQYGSIVTLTTKETISYNEYLSIEFSIKHKKNASIKINGQTKYNAKVTAPTHNSPQSTIYIGGMPEDEEKIKFSGGIKNIIIDNEPIRFTKDSVEDFRKVKIGRSKPITSPRKLKSKSPELSSDMNPINMKEMQNTEGCGKVLDYNLDPNAAKFGDKPYSYVRHTLSEYFWRKDYTLSLEFRTFYPNGMLFISKGPKQHYNLLEIKDGKIQLLLNSKRKRKITLSQKVDDGIWHKITIDVKGLKKKRKVVVILDNNKTKPMRMPKNKVQRELYIGGMPENVSTSAQIIDFQPFRGCIRSLKTNDVAQSLVKDKNTMHYNIGQCFPEIERGAYFGGDAYAIYSNTFRIDNILEIKFEFRTAEQNGIFLSFSDSTNRPALSLELQSGAVVMTADNGFGNITNVVNNLSDFVLCNNRWHNITALYTSSEIMVYVDGVRRGWVQPEEDSLMDDLEAPLYIGGIPDNGVMGTLKMKENFKGCIRNFKIGERTTDWIEIDKLHNILLESCPITT